MSSIVLFAFCTREALGLAATNDTLAAVESALIERVVGMNATTVPQ